MTLTALGNNELYFASSGSFNDPFDSRARKDFEFKDSEDFVDKWIGLERNRQSMTIDEAKAYLSDIASNLDKTEEYINEQSELFQKTVLQSFGICSLSEVNNDILMWSHYADSHFGLCLEFSRTPGNTLENAQPVEYPDDDDFPYINYWPDQEEEILDDLEKVVLTKSKHWKYEKEWRTIQEPSIKHEGYNGHVAVYPKEMLTGVIFGHRMMEKERKTIKKLLSNHSVEYYEASPVKNKFLIKVKKV